MTADRTKFCCCCGEPRRTTQSAVASFGNGIEIVHVADHREMKPGRWENSPQLLVGVTIRRNGGTDPGNTHICDGCIVVGLKAVKRFVDESLASIEVPQ